MSKKEISMGEKVAVVARIECLKGQMDMLIHSSNILKAEQALLMDRMEKINIELKEEIAKL